MTTNISNFLSIQQEKEYQLLLLISLVHELGAFFNDAWLNNQKGNINEEAAYCFANGNPGIDWPGFFNFLPSEERSQIVFILSHHHPSMWDDEKKTQVESDRIENTERTEWLAHIISEADTLTSGLRNPEKENSQNPLKPIFNQITQPQKDIAPLSNNNFYYYPTVPLNIHTLLPIHSQSTPNEKEYKQHIRQFIDELKQIITPTAPPPFETLYYVLKKYLWCIPAPYYPKGTDISLFDHLKTTTAVAGALYRSITSNSQTIAKEVIQNRRENRYSLIHGSISGIQKFIYNIVSKGASRGLKGRSFYLQILSDAVGRYILYKLGLPVSNLLYSSGGNFYILSNYIDETTVRDFENHVNAFLFEEFDGLIYFATGKIDFNGEQLTHDFANIWAMVSQEKDKSKSHKFKHIIEQDYDRVFAPGNDWGKVKFCSICGKENNVIADEERMKCPSCLKIEKIGARLKDFNYLGETINPFDTSHIEFRFDDFRIGYNIYQEIPSSVNTDEMLYRINNTELPSKILLYPNRGFRFYAGNEAPRMPDGELKTFDELILDVTGIKRLAVLRMDVDNLGFIFRQGLPREKRTLSMMMMLSFYFDMFFQAHINTLLKDVKNSIYIVYSGGDDLFIIGPWNIVVEKAIEIKQAFSVFVASNPALTLSAGIALMDYKHPISRVANIAGQAESDAKNYRKEKDAVCFLGKPLSWHNFYISRQIRNLIKEIAQDNKSIINRLKQIYILFKENETFCINHSNTSTVPEKELREKIFYNKWMWRMVYSFSRFEKNSEAQKEAIEELKKYLVNNQYRNEKTQGDAIAFIDIPARWAEFELRIDDKEAIDGHKYE